MTNGMFHTTKGHLTPNASYCREKKQIHDKRSCTPGDTKAAQKLAAVRTHQFLPEERVMLNADFPEPLGSAVVQKLKTNCAFKLLILEEGEDIEMHRIGGKREHIQNSWLRCSLNLNTNPGGRKIS